MKKLNRRNALKTGILGSLAGIAGASNTSAEITKKPATPAQIEGPYYPVTKQKDKDFDLTKIEGRTESAKGDVIWITGKIIDQEGNTIEDANVELWQANKNGRYNHPHETNKAPLDLNFQGWAIVPSGKDGAFKFKSIMPGAYPISNKVTRPPHIHFKVSKFGFKTITTQMYFDGNELNDTDRLLARAGELSDMLVAKKDPKNKDHYIFEIILAKAE